MPAGKNMLSWINMDDTYTISKKGDFFFLTSLRTQAPWWEDYGSDLPLKRCLIDICGRNE